VRLVPNADWRRTAGASAVICLVGGALVWCGTDGFRALTSEQARRLAVAASPRAIPRVDLEDQDGRPFALDSYRGRPLLVDFVYTRCRSVCPLLSDAFQRVDRVAQSTSAADGDERLQLVSITFDSLDTPADLRAYAKHYSADGRAWRFARVREPRELESLLRAFQVVVIPDGRGDFQHNAAFHVLNAEGRLARVLDPDARPSDIARAAEATAPR
jgi:protein SCO1/2